MIQETVIIPTKEGHQLTGVLRIPDFEGKFPAVIVCHGFLGNKDRELIFDVANGISFSRMVTLRFDFSAHGESGGLPQHVTLSQQVKDIRSAIEFLENVRQVDKDRIAIVGHDLGAMAALAAQDPRVKAYVTISMRSDVGGFIGSYFSEAEIKEWRRAKVYDCQEIRKLPVDFLHDIYRHDMLDVLSRLMRPLMIVQGTDDKRTPFENARALFYHSKFPTLELVEGADHNFSDRKHRQYVIGVMADWLSRTLR